MDNKQPVACYIRVSTLDQEKGAQSQEKALQDYVANHGMQNVKWYRDRVSGATLSRPAFQELQDNIFKGEIDTVVCWKLDRLSRSMRDGINVLADWCDRGVRVVSITQGLDFNGAVGKMIAGVLLAVAEMERENIRENIRRGQQAARARGVRWGGSQKGRLVKVTEQQVSAIVRMKAAGDRPSNIAAATGVNRSTVHRILRRVAEGHIAV